MKPSVLFYLGLEFAPLHQRVSDVELAVAALQVAIMREPADPADIIAQARALSTAASHILAAAKAIRSHVEVIPEPQEASKLVTAPHATERRYTHVGWSDVSIPSAMGNGDPRVGVWSVAEDLAAQHAKANGP